MVSEIVSFISLSLLVYKGAQDFEVLVLYPATLPNLVLSSSSIFMNFYG